MTGRREERGGNTAKEAARRAHHMSDVQHRAPETGRRNQAGARYITLREHRRRRRKRQLHCARKPVHPRKDRSERGGCRVRAEETNHLWLSPAAPCVRAESRDTRAVGSAVPAAGHPQRAARRRRLVQRSARSSPAAPPQRATLQFARLGGAPGRRNRKAAAAAAAASGRRTESARSWRSRRTCAHAGEGGTGARTVRERVPRQRYRRLESSIGSACEDALAWRASSCIPARAAATACRHT